MKHPVLCLAGLLLAACSGGQPQTVDVTRIVEVVAERPTVTAAPVEVTREVEVTTPVEVEVTRIVVMREVTQILDSSPRPGTIVTATPDVTPTPSPSRTPPPPASPTGAITEDQLLGRWATPDGFVYEFLSDHTFRVRARDGDVGTFERTWKVQEGGQIVLEGEGWRTPLQFKTETIALFELGLGFTTLLRLDAAGEIIPIPAESSLRPLPLFDVAVVDRVSFVDSWTGLSNLAPIEATFEMTRTNGAFEGTAFFSVAGYSDPLTETALVQVPVDVMGKTLATLAAVPVLEGPYYPNLTHTDDYPSVQLIARWSGGHIEFASESQGETHVPWKVVAGGEEYTAFSTEIAEALEALDPFLMRDVQERLIEQVDPDQ